MTARPLAFIDAAQARRALDRRACAAGLSGAGLRVWMIVADYTLGWCRIGDHLTHGRLAEETGLSRRSVRRALADLAEAGLIRYRPGVGNPGSANAYSRITVVMPKAAAREDSAGHSGEDEIGHSDPSEGTELATPSGQNWPLGEDGIGHSERPILATRRGRDWPVTEEGLTEGGQPEEGNRERTAEGAGTSASVVTPAREDLGETAPTPARSQPIMAEEEPPLPPAAVALVLADKGQERRVAEQIVSTLAEACRTGGHPLTRPLADLRPGVQHALTSGYSAEAVLVGLGWWRAEGYCAPRQIAEMVERAATRGPAPVGLTASLLLAEGARRYQQTLSRAPSPAEARAKRAVAGIEEWKRAKIAAGTWTGETA